jgi:5-formyltetrahydrofolate cyclo-ligase
MKQRIREETLLLRDSHPKEERERKDAKIRKLLLSLPEFRRAKRILFYVSVRSEVDTRAMISESMRMGKKVAVPITEAETRSLSISELDETNKDMEPGAFEIPEPSYPIIISPESIDLMVIPGVAFDRSGNRIGYGMGFYDRFLSDLRKDIPRIALAYGFQIVSGIPGYSGDVRMHKIVTESGVIDCLSTENGAPKSL